MFLGVHGQRRHGDSRRLGVVVARRPAQLSLACASIRAGENSNGKKVGGKSWALLAIEQSNLSRSVRLGCGFHDSPFGGYRVRMTSCPEGLMANGFWHTKPWIGVRPSVRLRTQRRLVSFAGTMVSPIKQCTAAINGPKRVD